jgi:tRNA1(Val) A37 N6-methylase TrmN6
MISVLDPCMGWGGRMYGFSASNRVNKYVGFDVSTETIAGLRNLKGKMQELGIDNNTDIQIHQHPFEESASILSTYDKFDLVMTSPPYFNIEKYSTDPDQSFIKFNTYDSWVDGFLRPSIELSYESLKLGGIIAFNVGYGKLYDDTHQIISETFGSVDMVYRMRLSKLCGRGVDKQVDKFKYEPIIIAKK